jgi:hypothetical protein
MRARIASLLALAFLVVTFSCAGSASNAPLDKCCVVTATDGTIVCFCGTSMASGDAFSVVVSGSTCTVTNTNDGGNDAEVTGAPPQAQADCVSAQSH